MSVLDILAPRLDQPVDASRAATLDLGDTTDVALDITVAAVEDHWLAKIVEESDRERRLGDAHRALELLGLALQLDEKNDTLRARYFSLAAAVAAPERDRRGDETLQITHS
jgi:hypothetical protein